MRLLLLLGSLGCALGTYDLSLTLKSYSVPDNKALNGQHCNHRSGLSCSSTSCALYFDICLDTYSNNDFNHCVTGYKRTQVFPRGGTVNFTLGANGAVPNPDKLLNVNANFNISSATYGLARSFDITSPRSHGVAPTQYHIHPPNTIPTFNACLCSTHISYQATCHHGYSGHHCTRITTPTTTTTTTTTTTSTPTTSTTTIIATTPEATTSSSTPTPSSTTTSTPTPTSTTTSTTSTPTTSTTTEPPTTFPANGCLTCYERLHEWGQTRSGVYNISLVMGNGSVAEIPAYCDMESDGGGWTLLQRREADGLSFARGWVEYKSGFGSPEAGMSYWAGNDVIAALTACYPSQLQVELESCDARQGPATETYPLFMVRFS